MTKTVLVVGAGAVGICTALYLQREGYKVILMDRQEPARGCSYGNAGMIQCSGVVPQASSGVLRSVPRMLFDQRQPLVIRWASFLQLLPFLRRFVAFAKPNEVLRIAGVLQSIVPRAFDEYQPLLEQAGATSMLRQAGELYVYASQKSYASARAAHDLRRQLGIPVQELNAAQMHAMEPGLSPDLVRAVYLPNSYQTVSPYRLLNALAKNLVKSGGQIVIDSLQQLTRTEHAKGGWCVKTVAGQYQADSVVVAMGVDSQRVANAMGEGVPLVAERGYHLMLEGVSLALRTTIISGDYKFGIAQLEDGIRLAGTAELARVDAPPNYKRAQRLFPLAQKILPHLKTGHRSQWMGARPSLPDSLPVISASKKWPNLFYAFGHGHAGLTLGAITGRLVTQLVSSTSPLVDLEPFRIDRFH